ncbi:hypothetical protein [Streptomyces sp. NBC_00878]|uniref:effector-associated constant component EACC1 n=1 Tax=Streptomyces sp. NBC_00878 TaxID=2975854 RepID=UPI0022510ECA|nr:hypothetical protein [Streptomyces sp. NBC_00878]MCX4904480.1 hypothetical protein [Streptomyces sp. NBC_00878]
MLVEMRVGDGGGLAAAELYRWLRQDPRIRRHAEVSLGSSRPDLPTMGAFDVVNLVIGQGIAALNLALSYAAWRATRRSAPSVTITVHGRSITVEGRCDDATIRRIVELLSAPADEPSRSENDLESA